MFNKLLKFLKIYKFDVNVKLKDGTELQIIGNLEQGAEVYVVTPDGNIAIPDGTYELETGEVLEVMDGKIVSIGEAAEAPEEEVIEEQAKDVEPETTAENQPVEEENIDFASKLAELEEKIAAIEAKLNEMSGTNDEFSREVKYEISSLKNILEKTDGAQPVKKFKSEETLPPTENGTWAYIMAMREKNKKK